LNGTKEMIKIKYSWLWLGVVVVLWSGCSRKPEAKREKRAVGETESGEGVLPGMHGGGTVAPRKVEKKVVVPEEVKRRWKAVNILVTDKSTGESKSYRVDINSEFEVPDTKLKIKVGAFLPDFSMSVDLLTSRSAEPNNPGLQVTIYEGGVEKYKGWLFAKFPDMHAFEHERYKIILEDNFEDIKASDKI